MKENKETIAMLFAAGLGTRLKPFTDKHPKALAVVNSKTLLQLNIEYLQQFGITKVVVNVHHFADQIIKIIQENKGWGSEVMISDETNEVLETGGGLLKAAPFFNGYENVVLMNVDILTNLNLNEMLANHHSTNALATLAVTKRNTSRYFLFNHENNLCGWMNTTTNEVKGIAAFDVNEHQQFAFSGIHIIKTKMLSSINRVGKFSLVDVYLDLMKTNTIKAFNHTGDLIIDVGKPESLELAATLFK
jgi:N-acetyl-alpha-D-muramate 1-phosphate uridylyltransferase